MKNKGTKRKAEQKQHESTKVVRRKTKLSKPQIEPELFRDQRELEDLWKHAYPVGTEVKGAPGSKMMECFIRKSMNEDFRPTCAEATTVVNVVSDVRSNATVLGAGTLH
ncbi:hypothetical protein Tco_1173667 [Tanacetum coccineum]